MPATQVACTNSKGLIWRAADGSAGSFRNNEQKAVAIVGKPDVSADLKAIIEYTYYAIPPLLYLLCFTYWTY